MTYAVLTVDPLTILDIKERLKIVDEKIKPGSTEYQGHYIRDAGSVCGDPREIIVFGPVGLEADNVTGKLSLADKVACWDMMDYLRQNEADSVQILCDNPEGPPNNAIICNGEWTDYEDLRVEGHSVHNCLATATGLYDSFYGKEHP